MNNKKIATEVAKHPLIRKILEARLASPSFVNKLIVQEILSEEEDEGAAQERRRRRLSSIVVKAALSQNVSDQTLNQVFAHPESDEAQQKSDVEKDLFNINNALNETVGQVLAAIKDLDDTNSQQVRKKVAVSLDPMRIQMEAITAMQITPTGS